MKKIIKIFLLITFFIISRLWKKSNIEAARQTLYNHLIKRFGEEFDRREYTVGDRKVK